MTPRKKATEEEAPLTVPDDTKSAVREAWELLAVARPTAEANLATWRQARARWRSKWIGE